MDSETVARIATMIRRRSSKSRAQRAVHRDRIRKETGSLMHSKQDPKSDFLCCIKSEGLCRTIGAKHHRRNKQCWNFANLCLHCTRARSAIDQENRSPGGVASKSGPSQKTGSEQEMTPTILNQIINKVSVAVNDKSTLMMDGFEQASPLLSCKSEDFSGETRQETSQQVPVSEDGPQETRQAPLDHVVYTIEDEDEKPPKREDGHASPLLDPMIIHDLERRRARSAAPTPESMAQRAVRIVDNVMLDIRKAVQATRDPRLDLNFVLRATS